jgi:hypothetical protein
MSDKYSKLAATGILLLVLATLWFIGGEPYIDLWQDRIAKAERLQRKQNSLRQLIRDRDHYEQQYRAVTESQGFQQVFLDDNSGALADAKLQRIVKQAVSDSGGKLLQAVIAKIRTGSKKNANGETETDKAVTIKVLMQGSIESIYAMLQALENSRPVVVISNLQITHQKSRYPVSPLASATSYRTSYDATAFIL